MEAKEDVGKCRGGDMEAENRGEGPPTGEPQGRTACRGATGERGGGRCKGEVERAAKKGGKESKQRRGAKTRWRSKAATGSSH
jgi:hypothetical protein